MKKRVYPDTNIALHYRRFDEIDWLRLVSATEVDLVISPVFVSELDQKKNGGARLAKQRAASVSSWLGRLDVSVPIRPGVQVVLELNAPELSVDFLAERLHVNNSDDRLVACLIASTAAGHETVCVTADLGLTLKLKQRGIPVVEPDVGSKLPEEQDAVQEENRQLKKKLADAVGELPDLSLTFSKGDGILREVSLAVRAPLAEEMIERHLAERRVVIEDTELAIEPMRTVLGHGRDKNEIVSFLDEWVRQARAWLQAYSATEVARSLTFQLGFQLKNDGAGSADDVDVDIEVPPFVNVESEREFPKREGVPLMPGSVENFVRAAKDIVAYEQRTVPAVPRRSAPPSVVDLDDGRKVRIHAGRLKHGDHKQIAVLSFWFKEIEDVKSFPITYRILSLKGKPTTGTLNVRIEARLSALSIPSNDE